MSDDLQNRVARAIDPEAFEFHDTCLGVWERRRDAAYKAADAAIAELVNTNSEMGAVKVPSRTKLIALAARAKHSQACDGGYGIVGIPAAEAAVDAILAAIEPTPVSAREAARVLLDALNEESELDDVIQTAMQGEADTDETDEWVFVLRAGLRAIAEGKDDD